MPVNMSEVMDRFEVEGIPMNHAPRLVIQENIENNDHRLQVFGAGLDRWEIDHYDGELDNPEDIWEPPTLSPNQSYVLRIIVLPILTIAVFFSLTMDFISSILRERHSDRQREKFETSSQINSIKSCKF